MKETSLEVFKLPMRVPSRVSDRSRKAKASRSRVVFPSGFRVSDFPKVLLPRILKLQAHQKRRLEDTWLALAGFFAIAVPGVVKGITLDNEENRLIARSITRTYRWLLKSWINSGGDWVLKRLKNLGDWSLYYATESDFSPPEVIGGSLGETREGWQNYSFLNGGPLSAIRPTRGPFRKEPVDPELTHFLLYELYSVKGALPLPSKASVRKAFRLHRETLSSGGKAPDELVVAARTWASLYRKKFPPKNSSMRITINNSAILESSRSKGGRSSWLRSYIENLKKNFSTIDLKGFQDITYDVFGDVRVAGSSVLREDIYSNVDVSSDGEFAVLDSSKAWQEISILHLLDDARVAGWVPEISGGTQLWPEGENRYYGLYSVPPKILYEGFSPKKYETRASVVEEQGDKARIITILPGVLSTLLHLLRTYSYSSLGKNPQIGTVSGEGTLFSFMKRANKFLSENPELDITKKVILSLDLTRATDTFYHNICSGLSEGYFLGSSSGLIKVLSPLATSPLAVEYPKGSGCERLEETSRGVLMGNPSSWFLLNLFTEFHWDLSGFLEKLISKNSKGSPEELLKLIFKKDGTLRVRILKKIREFSYLPERDPLSSRCGDDQISLCGLLRALIFEKLLVVSGGIISPGVHFRSDLYGIYTKQYCFLDRTKRQFSFVDILRVRSLSTPDSRLPGRKEIPPSWTRGGAASRELEWWKGDSYKDSVYLSSCTFLHWRYHSFLESCRSMGLELYLPQSFGGLNYPHPQREVKLQGKTKRMLSILLRNDISLSHLLEGTKLGSLWTQSGASPLGRAVEDRLHDFLMGLETKSYEGFVVDAPQPVYPKWWTLDEYTSKITKNSPQWRVLRDVMDELSGRLYDVQSFRLPGVSIQEVPGVRSIAKRFSVIRDQILSSDPFKYKPFKVEDFREIEKRRDWKLKSLMVNTEDFDFLIPSLLDF